jgi:signal transduction histidine kinase
MLSTSDHPIGCGTAGFALNPEPGFAASDSTRDRAHEVQTVAQVSDLIAHDFNNLLQVVKSALHIIERRERGASSDLSFVMKQALQSVDKAAAITHRLLALSQPPLSNPQPMLCSVAVRAMAGRLRAMLGPDIELELLLSHELPPITCDIGQLENAVMNLAFNAKAAMPNGGLLRIETYIAELPFERAGLERGRYNALSVTDTGHGMTPEVARRAFDLFYSADSARKGEGLGLSAVKAFAEQCKGHVHIASALGCGTSVRLYLPSYP